MSKTFGWRSATCHAGDVYRHATRCTLHLSHALRDGCFACGKPITSAYVAHLTDDGVEVTRCK
eukprot:6480467-Amphidinium_carterae.2